MTKNLLKTQFYYIHRDFFVCLFLIIATLSVYWQVRNYEFVNYDDPLFITKNRTVTAGLTLEGIKIIATNPENFCRILPMLSHMNDQPSDTAFAEKPM